MLNSIIGRRQKYLIRHKKGCRHRFRLDIIIQLQKKDKAEKPKEILIPIGDLIMATLVGLLTSLHYLQNSYLFNDLNNILVLKLVFLKYKIRCRDSNS